MKKQLFSFLLFLIFLPVSGMAQEDSLKKELAHARPDSTKIRILLELSSSKLEDDLSKAEQYAKQALELSTKRNFMESIASSNRYLGLAQFYQAHYGEAVDSWLKSLAAYDSVGDKANVARMYSNLGAVYESQSDDVKALEFNLKSQKVAEEISDTSRLMSALTNIGVIYGKKKQTYEKALTFSFEALKYATALDNKELVSKISTNIGEIYFSQNKDTLALQYFEKSIAGYEGSESLTSALLNIGKVYASRGDYASAEKYQNQSFGIAQKMDLQRDMATALLSLANTLSREGQSDEALATFNKARVIAESINVPEEMKQAYNGLARLYSQKRDFVNAFKYQALLTNIKDTLYNIEYQQKMSGELFNFEIGKKQDQITILNKDKELQEVDLRRQRLAKNASLVGLMLILVIAFILFRNYRVKVRVNKILDQQKVQIEHLLLNILPEEVAQELKTDGFATPRSYDSVSVLFTDFKGFTTIAEGMKPADLVAELNTFFVAFDDIIEKNNLEKIKTIGDAYMCAGGIPTPNTSHPYDIIKAGLQIQEYMNQHNLSRREAGLPVWGLRVGVHTGPITAGVVGKKKYAYDIWGSAVNIASRMESNGEVGKVNISEATYILVKEQFSCTHRGKISAKNIGEIDMYFVESEIAVVV